MTDVCPQRALSPSDSGIDDDSASTPLCRFELTLPELKDEASSMASSKEEVGLMPRQSRLTQSMFNRRPRVRPPATTRDPDVLRERERRRMSLEHREKNLELWTKDYMRQLEEVIRTTKDLQEKEDENERLHQEVEDLRYMMEELRAQIEEKDSVIEEYREFINEQQSQLTAMRRQTATSRSEAERFKVENMVLTTATSPQAYEQLMTKYKSTKREASELQRNLAATQALVERLQEENQALTAAQAQQPVSHRFSIARTEVDEDVDERSKNELLRVIRRVMEDKIKWETYAERLLRTILLGHPQLLDIRERTNVAHCCASEARWEAFSLVLVHHVMERCPDILDLVRTPTQTDGEKLSAARTLLV